MSKRKTSKGFWNIVRKIIREIYDTLINADLRGGHYIMRNHLTKLIGKTITDEDYKYFLSDEGYDYYSQDVWTQLEQNGENPLKRPEAKLVGMVWDRGSEETIKHLEEVWEQARGFIFTEKMGEKLAKLSEFGWCIIEPDQGYPTRFIRKVLKQDKRPVIAIHDADQGGNGIYRALGFDTRRTKHLNIAVDNVIDLGLRWKDQRALDLPTQLEAEKFRIIKEDRCELDSLAVLTDKYGIENPFLNYVIIRMVQEGITISPTLLKKEILLRRELKWKIREALKKIVNPIVDEFVDGKTPKGNAVDVRLPNVKQLKLAELEELVRKLTSRLEKQSEWLYEKDYHHTITKDISKKMKEMMK